MIIKMTPFFFCFFFIRYGNELFDLFTAVFFFFFFFFFFVILC